MTSSTGGLALPSTGEAHSLNISMHGDNVALQALDPLK